jgi:hypothetical protein
VYAPQGCRGGRPLYARAAPANATAANASASDPRFLVFSAYWGDWDFASAAELSDDNTLGYGGEGDAERRPELVPARDWYVRASLDDARAARGDATPDADFVAAPTLAVRCEDACNDGRWNFNEEGVDCGGDCAPCAEVYPPPSAAAGEAELAAIATAKAEADASRDKLAAAAAEAQKAAEAAVASGDEAKAKQAKADAQAAVDAHAAAAAAADAAREADVAAAARNAQLAADLAALRTKLAGEQRAKDESQREEAVARVAVVGVVVIGACIVMGGPLLFYLKKGQASGGIGPGFAQLGGSADKPPRGGGKRRAGGV